MAQTENVLFGEKKKKSRDVVKKWGKIAKRRRKRKFCVPRVQFFTAGLANRLIKGHLRCWIVLIP